MNTILVAGAGKVGRVIARALNYCGDYRVIVADTSSEALNMLRQECPPLTFRQLDFNDEASLRETLRGVFAVINALPFRFSRLIAPQAVAQGIHYFDLTEDVESTRLVKQLAGTAKTALVPQCGLAPGFVSIAAASLLPDFDELHSVQLRVGALPLYPNNALKYNLTWNTEGLINEYLKPCEALVEGRLCEVPALEELEQFSLDGITYEAFNTSGGLGTLCDTLRGRCRQLNYRTVRYPGHRDLIKMLIKDLRLGENPELMRQLFENALPGTEQDVVLVYVSVNGRIRQQLRQKAFVRKVYAGNWMGLPCSAIAQTTAAGVCTALDLLVQGQLPQVGLIRQEDIPLKAFLDNRFGQVYAGTRGPEADHHGRAA